MQALPVANRALSAGTAPTSYSLDPPNYPTRQAHFLSSFTNRKPETQVKVLVQGQNQQVVALKFSFPGPRTPNYVVFEMPSLAGILF